MAEPERFETPILGSGNGGMYLAWHLAQLGRRTALVERRYIGGSYPNINCLPTKNQIWSAKVDDLVHHAARFGAIIGDVAIDMVRVRQRKRDMVDDSCASHHGGRARPPLQQRAAATQLTPGSTQRP